MTPLPAPITDFALPLVLLLALLLDWRLGETRYFHPLVGFGKLGQLLEKRLNREHCQTAFTRLFGCIAWCLLVLPLPAIYFLLQSDSWLFVLLDCFVLYLALGLNSLKAHALNIYKPLTENKREQARRALAMIVSRNTQALDETQISRATVESVLENGHDAVIASLFYYTVGGAPLVILHRLANTLDAMWGYKSERFIHFGWCAAKMDDLLGWPSAKASALLYGLAGSKNLSCLKQAIKNAASQSKNYKSLNGGWVMAAGATTLGFRLGGNAEYHGKTIQSPTLGRGRKVNEQDIKASLKLVTKASMLLVVVLFMASLFIQLLLAGLH